MRWGLGYWRETWRHKMSTEGQWILRWRNRGQSVQHTVLEADVDVYGAVPMGEAVASIRPGVQVLSCFGLVAPGTSSAQVCGFTIRTESVAEIPLRFCSFHLRF
jgi:hypothetical protein